MTPPTRELFRALLRRALGGCGVTWPLLLAALLGAGAGWLTPRYLGAGATESPSAGLLPWLIVHFPRTALYTLGVLVAVRLAAAYGDDVRTGWPLPYLAAGGTRDRYLLSLALAGACAHGLWYLLAVSAWLATATALGRPVTPLPADTAFLALGLAWLLSPAAFAAAAVALTAHGGRAVGLMTGVVLLPWLLLAAVRPDPAVGAHRWLALATLPSPPYPIGTGANALPATITYAAVLLAIAWGAAPRRILRI